MVLKALTDIQHTHIAHIPESQTCGNSWHNSSISMRSIIWWFSGEQRIRSQWDTFVSSCLLRATFIVVWYLTSIWRWCVGGWDGLGACVYENNQFKDEEIPKTTRCSFSPQKNKKKIKTTTKKGISPVPTAWLSVPKQPPKMNTKYTNRPEHRAQRFIQCGMNLGRKKLTPHP